MATIFQLTHFLAQLRRYVLRFLKGGFLSPVLVRILRHVTFLFSRFLSKWRSWRESRGRVDKPPSSSSGSSNVEESKSESSEEGFHSEPKQSTDVHFINPNRETISLQDEEVAYSLYPHSGDGIRSASRSSQNLRETRSARNLQIEARQNASRSSQHLSSQYSISARSSVSFESEAPSIQVIQPTSPTLPTTPTRKYSASLPYLPRHGERLTPHVSSPDIQLTEINSPDEIDATSIDIPTRSASPVSRLGTPISRRASPVYYPSLTYPASPIELDSPPRLDNPRILPVLPESTQRYQRRPRIQKKETTMTIQPMTTTFAKPIPPTGWIKHIHPEGGRYFFNEDKRIYTDADLYDTGILEQATRDINTLETFIFNHRIILPQDTDLVIDLYYEDGEIQNVYYYVHHSSRTIFFLDIFLANSDTVSSWPEISSIHTESHLHHEIHAQYWHFLMLYPHALEISPGLIAELRDVALHFIGDSMTSVTSTAPYTLEELHKILTLTDSLEKNVGYQCVGAVSLLSRLMYIFVHSKFLDFHGEPHARIERNFSVFGQAIYQRTLLIKTLSMFLFSAPDFHLRNLQKMWVDGIMHKSVWEQSMKKMSDEWQEFVLFATVMLNANVAFLSVQSVDTDGPNRSPAQISSYLSVVASIGSILIGLLLTRQNRTKDRETVTEVQNYLRARTHPRLGLETLAILYSLPYALLMWGMVSFLAAFLLMCFQDSSTSTRISVGSLFCAVVILVIWCIWTSWDERLAEEEPMEPSPVPPGSEHHDGESSIAEAKEPKTTLLSRIALPAFLLRRRTIDSQRTVA